MANMKDFHKAYGKLMAAGSGKFSESRNLKMERDSWLRDIYYTAYIAGDNLTKRSGAISNRCTTPMEAVNEVIKMVEKMIEEEKNDAAS